MTSEDTGGTTTFTYDGNGNQTVIQKPNGDRTTQVWDYENRLIKTIQPSGGVTSMAYDADGLRVKLEESTGTKLFVWDDQNYLAETDAAGTTQAAFTTEPSTYGSLISHRKSGSTTTYHFDALGSTRALTDASEAVLESYNYGAFGTLLGSPTLLTPFLWGGMVGYYWDAALATQYIRARHYQPTIARWISLDPIGFAGGDANLFRYVGNSPTSGATGMRVRLSASAYGQWQMVVARSVLSYLTLALMHESIKRRYFEGNLDRSGHAVTEDACTESLLKAFDDPQYQKLLNLYGKCVRPTIRCEVCGENAVPGLLVKHGGFDSKANEIVLCCDVLSDKTLDTSVLNSVIHETIHAIDHCRSPLPDKSKVTCQQLLCIEARAYSCSNQCPQQDGQDRKDCLMRLLNLYTVGAPCQTTKDLDQALIDSKKQMEEALARKECICARPCKDGRLPETPENWELPPVAVK